WTIQTLREVVGPHRKELQGPRPTPLKVRKESHRIKKPPVGPSNNQQPAPQPTRQPVIIYTVSPKVIHTHPSEFMTLVQRLTGPDATLSSYTTSSSSSSSIVGGGSYCSSTTHSNMAHHVSGAISPAARFATIEKTKMHSEVKKFVGPTCQGREEEVTNNMDVDHGTSGDGDGGGGVEGVERTMFFPGILSLDQVH
ncbi:Nuclear speckle RNA-binding protein B, partial [Bienertia sinuspersici]